MSDAPTLFDAPVAPEYRPVDPPARKRQARRARDEALERVEAAAPAQWTERAYAFLVDYLRHHETMFPDDLWEAGLEEPHELRAIGPVLLRARRAGLMVKTGELRQAVRSHLTERPVWRSLIFENT